MKIKRILVLGTIGVVALLLLVLGSGVALAQKPAPPASSGALLPGETGGAAPAQPFQDKAPVANSGALLPGETGVSAPAQPFQDKAPVSGGYVPALPGEKAAQP